MRRIPVVLTLCLFIPSARAQSVLPRSFSSWTTPETSAVAPQNAESAVPQAAILREYGLVEIEQGDYSLGNARLQVTLYRMRDPSAAYGAFTFLRSEEMRPGGLADYSAISPKRALMLRGNLVVEATGKNLPALTRDLAVLQSAVARHAETGPYPSLEFQMPKEGLVPNSQRYIAGPLALHEFLPLADGDWAGFSTDAEAEMARYRINGREVSLLLVDFPTPQAAEARLKIYARQFTLNPADAAHEKSALFAKRDMTLIALVSGASSQKIADRLLKGVHSGEEVTWNEPAKEALRPFMIQAIINAITGTGILCLYTLIAGFAFGGFRLLVKRILPGRVFDRPSSTEVLQLGISSKPIETKDFYAGPGL